MIRCDELVGKVFESFSVYEDGPYGPEILVEFTDGTLFNSCLRTAKFVEAKLLRKTDSGSTIVKDFLRGHSCT